MAGWMSRSWPALMTRLAINFKLPLRTNNELDCLGDDLVDFIIISPKKKNVVQKMQMKRKITQNSNGWFKTERQTKILTRNLNSSLFPHRQKKKKIRKPPKKIKRMVKRKTKLAHMQHSPDVCFCFFPDKFVLDETTEKQNFDTWKLRHITDSREEKNRNATTQFPCVIDKKVGAHHDVIVV